MEIKELRKKLGITQVKLSSLTNIPLDTIRSWEQGRRNPPSYVSEYVREIIEKYKQEMEDETQ